ncbi:MAG: hypothetical protein MI861_00385 [Pirellulales bacterium]|nr:hypothetical protein [Pirellulales bacterium]
MDEPRRQQLRRRQELWKSYQTLSASAGDDVTRTMLAASDGIAVDERELLTILQGRKRPLSLFELKARASVSGARVNRALRLLRRQGLVRIRSREARPGDAGIRASRTMIRITDLGRTLLEEHQTAELNHPTDPRPE